MKPNDNRLNSQITGKEKFGENEPINDLFNRNQNQQYKLDWIRLKLEKAEQSGFTTDSQAQILKESKELLNENEQIQL